MPISPQSKKLNEFIRESGGVEQINQFLEEFENLLSENLLKKEIQYEDIGQDVLSDKHMDEMVIFADMFKGKKSEELNHLYYLAAINGHKYISKMLLNHANYALEEDPIGRTPLHYAAKNGHLDIVKLLLEYYDSELISFISVTDNKTALQLAIEQGHTEIVKLLIEKNPEVLDNMVSIFNNNKTALHIAAEVGHLEIAKVLLLIKPEMVNMVDSDGRPPLFYTAGLGYIDFFKFLLQNNAEVRVVSEDGPCLLDIVVNDTHEYPGSSKDRLEILYLLMSSEILTQDKWAQDELTRAQIGRDSKPNVIKNLFRNFIEIAVRNNQQNPRFVWALLQEIKKVDESLSRDCLNILRDPVNVNQDIRKFFMLDPYINRYTLGKKFDNYDVVETGICSFLYGPLEKFPGARDKIQQKELEAANHKFTLN